MSTGEPTEPIPKTDQMFSEDEYVRSIDEAIAAMKADSVEDPDPETQAELDNMFGD